MVTLDELPKDLYGSSSEDIKHGDLNGDTLIDSLDYALLQKYILGTIQEFDVSKEAADLNGDGSINSMDCTLLRSYILGLIETFPVDKE